MFRAGRLAVERSLAARHFRNVRWLWPLLAVAILALAGRSVIQQIDYLSVREVVRAARPVWAGLALMLTVGALAVMGLYDVICFRRTPVPRLRRWGRGMAAFAWSNFLTLGPLAGPAMRFWLYRPAVEQLSDLHGGVIAVAVAFSSGLAAWTTAALVSRICQRGPKSCGW